jgi:hypothetical protein
LSVDNYWGNGANYASNGQIQNKSNGMCINLSGGNTNPVNDVIAYPCTTVAVASAAPPLGRIRPWNEVWGAGTVTSTGAAYIFARFTPPLFGKAIGHVAWAVQLADGSWEGGAWDGPELSNGFTIAVIGVAYNNNAWRHHFANEDDVRKYFLLNECFDGLSEHNPYDQYIRVPVTSLPNTLSVNTAAVFSLESQSWDWGYGVAGNNCMNIVYGILRAYGWNLPAPSPLVPYPINWFKNVAASMNATIFWLHGQPWDTTTLDANGTAIGPFNSAIKLFNPAPSLGLCWK